jgi:hypothetical protein
VLERIDTTDAAIAAGSNGNGRDRGPRAASGMAPRATGAIETHEWRDGRTVTVRARLRAYGRRYRIAFGTNHEGWSVERARVELDRILQHVERGTWDPPSRADNSTAALEGDETVHVTASRWWQRRNAELAPKTRVDYRWRLDHMLRLLAHETTAELDVHRVDAFRGELEAAAISPRSVNMILDTPSPTLRTPGVPRDAVPRRPAHLRAHTDPGRAARPPRRRTPARPQDSRRYRSPPRAQCVPRR